MVYRDRKKKGSLILRSPKSHTPRAKEMLWSTVLGRQQTRCSYLDLSLYIKMTTIMIMIPTTITQNANYNEITQAILTIIVQEAVPVVSVLSPFLHTEIYWRGSQL